MIIYYSANDLNITGLSHNIDTNREDEYFECFDPVADKIFRGEEKLSKYKVSIDPTTKKGSIILKGKVVNRKAIKDLIHLVSKEKTSNTSIFFKQDVDTKTLKIEITDLGKKESDYFNVQTLTFAACLPNDPFNVLWAKRISLDNDTTIEYSGVDDFRIYVYNCIGTYEHIVTSPIRN